MIVTLFGGHSGTLAQPGVLSPRATARLRVVVPESVRVLLALAEVWGLGDDIERSLMVERASTDQLQAMVAAVNAVPEDDLYGWLSGGRSHTLPLRPPSTSRSPV